MTTASWDILCSREDPDSLWFGYHLARTFAERQQTVRLFTDEIRALSIAQREVDPRLWMQTHASFQLVDRRLARFAAPANHLLQVFDTPVSRAYLGRFISQSRHGYWFQVRGPWHAQAAESAIALLEATSSYHRYAATIGDTPAGAGYVKPQSYPFHDRRSRAWAQHARSGLINLLGLPQALADHETGLFVDGRIMCPFEPWVRALVESEIPLCLFIGAGPLQEQLAGHLQLEAGVPAVARCGAASIVFLPPLVWFMEDEFMATSDVVFAGSGQVALRASERGTPVLLGTEPAADAAFLQWYARDTRDELVHAMGAMAESLRTGRYASAAWGRYLSRRTEFRALAAANQARIAQGPELADVLLASLLLESVDRVDRSFAPTQPLESLEG